MRPEVGIKVAQIFLEGSQKVATTDFYFKIFYFKLAEKLQ